LHSYHFYLEAGLPHTRVLLWVAGESLRAVFENVIVAAYCCRDDWQNRQVKDIQGGVFYPTPFAPLQGTLIPLTRRESLVVYRPTAHRRRAPHPATTRQLLLFEFVSTG
jgi:hypothetical protein